MLDDFLDSPGIILPNTASLLGQVDNFPISQVQLAPLDGIHSRKDFFINLPYPLLVSPKIDGIRSVGSNDSMLSRKMKRIPSLQVQGLFAKKCKFMDGELTAGLPYDVGVFNLSSSHIMSVGKPHDDIRFHLFDYVEYPDLPYYNRLEILTDKYVELKDKYPQLPIFMLDQKVVHNEEELLIAEEEALALGYEGLMARSIHLEYKQGRATYNQGYIFKIKRFEDFEVAVVDLVEGETNLNEATLDERGYTKRSSAKAGKIASDTLGKILIEYEGRIVPVALGVMTHEERKIVWDNRSDYIGRTFVCRHFPYGAKVNLRMPRFNGWRNMELDS